MKRDAAFTKMCNKCIIGEDYQNRFETFQCLEENELKSLKGTFTVVLEDVLTTRPSEFDSAEGALYFSDARSSYNICKAGSKCVLFHRGNILMKKTIWNRC